MAFDPSWLTLGSIGSSLLGGLFGGGSSSEQREFIGEGFGTYDAAMESLNRSQGLTRESLEEANMVLASVEPAVLAGMDEQLRVRVAQQVMTDRQNYEAQQQRLASAGLDSTTVAPGMQRGQAWGQSQQTANTAAAFAVMADSVGMVQQFSPDVILGSKSHKHVWDMEILPVANIPIGVYQYDGAIDGSTAGENLGGAATDHLTATKVEAYGFHHAAAFITPYNSSPSTNPSSIAKVVLANA